MLSVIVLLAQSPPIRVKFAVGDKVEHKVFGIGEIIEATPERDSYKVLFEKWKQNLVSRVLH